MFSNLGPLFKTTFRLAETSDARLAIPHEERDQRRKEEEEEQQQAPEDPWQDNTSVTVTALRTFLINFLKTLPGGEDIAQMAESNQTETYQTPSSARPKETARPTNTRNAKAVRAYQSMAEKSVTVTPDSSSKEETKKRVEPTADLLQSQELRDIYALIQDLDILIQNNVRELEIKKADSFLEALKNAVRDRLG